MNRVIPGILLDVGWLLLIALGSFQLFWAIVLLIGYLAGREYCRMAFTDISSGSERVMLTLILIVPMASVVFCRQHPETAPAGLLLGLIALALFVFFYYQQFARPLTILSRGMLGLAYVGFLGAHLVLVRGLVDGAHWLIILTAVTAGSDTGAYLAGSKLGRRKLCPHISPNKTVEGGFGGIVGGIVAALILSLFFPVAHSSWFIGLLAFVLSLVGMVGDLLESVIKRGYGVKDSGTLLAGHGGVLDRIDSLLLAAPVLYYMLIYSGI